MPARFEGAQPGCAGGTWLRLQERGHRPTGGIVVTGLTMCGSYDDRGSARPGWWPPPAAAAAAVLAQRQRIRS